MKRNRNAVILLSGGLDSTTVLYYALNKGYQLSALIFDYNQRHKRELRAAKKVALLNKVRVYCVSMRLPWVCSALTRTDIAVPQRGIRPSRGVPVTYVSGRNIIFLSYAASLAESINAHTIFLGAHVQDYSGYPDCRREFITQMESALNRGLARVPIKILSPLLDKTKKEIVSLGVKLGVPYKYTWSCYQGGKVPCKKCDSCRFRIQAFREIGMVDPLLID